MFSLTRFIKTIFIGQLDGFFSVLADIDFDKQGDEQKKYWVIADDGRMGRVKNLFNIVILNNSIAIACFHNSMQY